MYLHVCILTACCGLLCVFLAVFLGAHLDYSFKMVSSVVFLSILQQQWLYIIFRCLMFLYTAISVEGCECHRRGHHIVHIAVLWLWRLLLSLTELGLFAQVWVHTGIGDVCIPIWVPLYKVLYAAENDGAFTACIMSCTVVRI